jgi:hypothetical protein
MVHKHINLWVLFITIGMVYFVYHFYTTVMHPVVVYPNKVSKILYLDESFNQDEVELIGEAAQEWNLATDGIVSYTIRQFPVEKVDYDNGVVIMRVNHYYPDVLELDLELEQVTLGYCNSTGHIKHIALVYDRLEDETFKPVVLHELGHSLGLKHNEDDAGIGTLMYPSVDLGSTFITHKDLVNFCLLYHCDASKLHDQEEPLHP